MPRLIWSAESLRDLSRLRRFLDEKNPRAAARAVQAIRRALNDLLIHPMIGRPVEIPGESVRELVIPFGSSGGYVARYSIEKDAVVIASVRHGREVVRR